MWSGGGGFFGGFILRTKRRRGGGILGDERGDARFVCVCECGK